MSRLWVGIMALAALGACNSGSSVFSPAIHGLSPGHGPKAGGTYVLIQGSQLTDVDAVMLGAPATIDSVAVDRVGCWTGAHSAGAVTAEVWRNGIVRAISDEPLFVYDPDSWGRLGSDSTPNGLNVDPTQIVTTADAAALDGDHYVIWREVNPTATQARVAVYDPDDQTWTSLDGGGTNGINKNPAGNVEHPRLLRHDDHLYAAWTERNPISSRYQVRVALWTGSRATPSWQFIDGDGADGLNLNVNQDADGAILASWNGKLVVAWSEFDGFGAGHIHAASYDPTASSPSWTPIDDSSDAGLNYNAAESAQRPSATVHGGDLVLSWFETGGGVGHVRVAIYEPTRTSVWRFLDGATANGLNLDPTKDAHSCQVFTTRRHLYCTFVEANANGVQQLRLAHFGGNTSTISIVSSAKL